MSSKFGGIPKTQKPPAVCKAPPPADYQPPVPFDERTFQGYCEWYDSMGTDRIQTTGPIIMNPEPITPTWIGWTPGEAYTLRLHMQHNTDPDTFDFTIDLLLFGASVGQYVKIQAPPRSMDPFDSGLIDFIGQGGQVIVQCRIMS